jgi:competence protein ComEA
MEKKKYISIILGVLFIIASGIVYSFRNFDVKEPQINLQDLNESKIQESKDEVTLGKERSNNQSTDKDYTGNGQDKDQKAEDNQKVEDNQKAGDNQMVQESPDAASVDAVVSDKEEVYIYVHICGAVKKPDVYKVEKDSRLFDIIKLAGGLTNEAAGDFVNQAEAVSDGQKVYIPTKKETAGMSPLEYASDNSNSSTSMNTNTATGSTDMKSSKININTAGLNDLMTLSGIGEARANSIIAYRQEHGGFKTVEEIKNIDGIKDSVFNKISNFITVK